MFSKVKERIEIVHIKDESLTEEEIQSVTKQIIFNEGGKAKKVLKTIGKAALGAAVTGGATAALVNSNEIAKSIAIKNGSASYTTHVGALGVDKLNDAIASKAHINKEVLKAGEVAGGATLGAAAFGATGNKKDK